MALDKPPFAMVAVVTLDRGAGSAAEALRRSADIADEIGASGIDVDGSRVALLVPGALVNVDLEHAMRALAGRLLRRFGWRDDDLVYVSNLGNAQTVRPPSRPAAVALVIEREGQVGNEGETHGADVGPVRDFQIDPGEEEVLARLFVTVPATTVAEAIDGLRPWLARVEPAAIGLDRLDDGRFRAGLLWRARGDLRAEAGLLGLGAAETGRIEADADHLIETATAADGTAVWLRRGADPVSPHWPGLLETRPMVVEPGTMTEEQVASLMRTLSEMLD